MAALAGAVLHEPGGLQPPHEFAPRHHASINRTSGLAQRADLRLRRCRRDRKIVLDLPRPQGGVSFIGTFSTRPPSYYLLKASNIIIAP
jgi:hypothetical protein